MYKLKTLLIIIALLTLVGCADTTEIGDRAIVQLAAVDYADGEYTLSALLFSAGGSGGTVDSTKANTIKVQGRGTTIEEAVKSLSLADGKDIYMSESKLLVLGGGFSDTDVTELLMKLYKDMRFSLNTPICTAEKAELLTDFRFTEGITSAEKPYSMIINADRMGEVKKQTLLSVLRNHYGGRETALPNFTEGENGSGMTEDGDSRTIILSGTRVVADGRLSPPQIPK